MYPSCLRCVCFSFPTHVHHSAQTVLPWYVNHPAPLLLNSHFSVFLPLHLEISHPSLGYTNGTWNFWQDWCHGRPSWLQSPSVFPRSGWLVYLRQPLPIPYTWMHRCVIRIQKWDYITSRLSTPFKMKVLRGPGYLITFRSNIRAGTTIFSLLPYPHSFPLTSS